MARIAPHPETPESAEGASEDRRCRGRPQVRPDHETRQVIYEAARHEFADSGYAATSMETVARRAGISTRTLYRLVPNKASLFEGMVSDRLDRFLSSVNLQLVDHAEIEQALYAALMACADLSLDEEVVALQRMVLQEAGKSSDIAGTFYRNGIQRTLATLADWLRGAAAARLDRTGRCRGGRRDAAGHGRLGAAARRDLWRRAAAVAGPDRGPGARLRSAVFAGVWNLRPEAAPALLTAALLTN